MAGFGLDPKQLPKVVKNSTTRANWWSMATAIIRRTCRISASPEQMGVQLGESSPNLSGAVPHLCIGRSDFELGAFRQKEPDAELAADDPWPLSPVGSG
jgi:hypothetical protein